MNKLVSILSVLLLLGISAYAGDLTSATKESLKTSVILNSTVEIPETVYNLDKKGKVVSEHTIYRQRNLGCSGNYVTPNHILTNRHCVDDSIGTEVNVGKEYFPAELIYQDNREDLAILHTERTSEYWLEIATSNPTVGQEVYAYGHPAGITFTLTKGIISKITREDRFLVLDLTILPGSSGSALLNTDGKLVGVVNSIWNLHPFTLIPSGLSGAVSSETTVTFLKKVGILPDTTIWIRRDKF